jgi:hypothetical protein
MLSSGGSYRGCRNQLHTPRPMAGCSGECHVRPRSGLTEKFALESSAMAGKPLHGSKAMRTLCTDCIGMSHRLRQFEPSDRIPDHYLIPCLVGGW